MNIWYVVVALCLLTALFLAVLKRYGLRGLVYTRSFSQPAYFAGQEGELVEVVRNDRPLLLPWLRVESRMPVSMRFGRQEDLTISGEMYHRSVFLLMPYQQITRRHRVRMTHRGAFDLGNATLTAGDALGLCQAREELALNVPVLVYPRLLSEEETPTAFSRMLGDCLVRRSLLTDPFLVNGIRPYRMGDSMRDIHWTASARTQTLQVRTHDYTAQTRLLVIINCQLREDQWDALMDYDQPVVEQEISLAATMCVQVLRAGLTAGFAANMPQADERVCTVFSPVSGADHEEELLSAMARLRVMMSRSFPSFVEENLLSLSGYDMLVISPYDGPSLRQPLHALRLKGNTVRLYVLDQGEVPLHA